MKSLDPRINRWKIPEKWVGEFQKEQLDQLETYEVFVQPKEDRPYQHEGIVHAPNEEMAFVFAKEQFSRRATCTGLMIARTPNIYVSPFTENEDSVYDHITQPEVSPGDSGDRENFEIFHLLKRGKQHKHAGTVEAIVEDDALFQAKLTLNPGKPVFNVWVIKSDELIGSNEEDQEIWHTLPDKTFREATDYRGADKIKKFKEEGGQK